LDDFEGTPTIEDAFWRAEHTPTKKKKKLQSKERLEAPKARPVKRRSLV